MPKELHEWCLATCRENMAALYERVWTWNDTKKRKQLSSAASRFLIAHDAGAGRTPLAYVNYRFEEDEGHAVLYCYELQVVRAAQSRGLGRLLMELTEQIAWGSGMSKLVLTVFCENTAAVAFYRKLGYVLDETSPDYCPSGSNLVSSKHQMPSLGLQAERRVPADCKSLALQRELAEQLLLPSPHQLLHPPPPPQQPLEQQSLVHVLSDMPQEEQQLQVQQVLEQS
ncbi:hypothetical protein VOLCADRAFT_104565 [Volvox carteri f. nagariensis]|uniref:N-alpha-acetyltransferase 40 n=1 Tax=Volvox carteri f. nagariensis TaxID=3068 RepID=D8TUH2_VOLCA|nr:uncharacterized protein VOLCADRAFT_104565 [Volvox carteri f. nagariensis]EFJ48824.1 hypothetical protein VOLCADRAFT_104565 [Volvox carteri f. nagariensis]|eukprot:XP_002950156.1 hypothetical protein VOLCADRAFT_104565 [Volvox carteri f. nagariensis]